MCVADMGDFGDCGCSLGCSGSGSFQVSRPGSGGSSLLRLTVLESPFLLCSDSSVGPFEVPGRLLLRELDLRGRFQPRQPDTEPLRCMS